MKIKIFLLFIIFTTTFIILYSCKESNLNVVPGFATEDTYYENDAQFREGVLGVYSKLVYFYNYNKDNFLHDVRLLEDDDLNNVSW